MRKIFFVTLFALGAGVTCFSQTQTGQGTTLSPQEYLELTVPALEEDSLQIITNTAKTKYKGGEEIILDITLKNTGTKTFSARPGNDDVDFFYDIEVTGPDGVKVAFLPTHERRRSGPETRTWSVTLENPKEGSVWLNNLFELKYVGKYRVVVSKKFRRGKTILTLASNPLDFELLSNPPIAEWK